MKLREYETNNRVFIIAELGQAHDGSFGILQSLVSAAAQAGVDAVKFQTHIAEAESSAQEPFRVKFSAVDRTRFDYWRRMELTVDQWRDLRAQCVSLGVEFLSTPFSNQAVDLLEEVGVQRYKIGSGDAANPLMIEKIAKTGKELILSTGLVSSEELAAITGTLRSRSVDFSILECTSRYPTSAADVCLPNIGKFRALYECPTGLSDHSGTIFPSLGAVALGATVVEVHLTFDKLMFGPDSKASLTVDELKTLVGGVRFLEQARVSGEAGASVSDEKANMRTIFGKALCVNREMHVDEVITFDDLEGKKPGDAGISVKTLHQILGKKLKVRKDKWDFIQREDFE